MSLMIEVLSQTFHNQLYLLQTSFRLRLNKRAKLQSLVKMNLQSQRRLKRLKNQHQSLMQLPLPPQPLSLKLLLSPNPFHQFLRLLASRLKKRTPS